MTAKPKLHDPTAAQADEKWRSQCCRAEHVCESGELSTGWFHMLSGTGRYIWLRSGLCGKCGQRANFDRERDR